MAKRERPAKKGMWPLSADVEAHMKRVRSGNPDLVKIRRVKNSVQGRPIYAVTITDPAVPDRRKQNALIIAGQHGGEESGRMSAMAIVDWLTTKAAATTRKKQKVVVMPNVNPDAAETGQQRNANNVNPNRDHALTGPTSPEGEAFEIVADQLQPEVYMDMHACGGIGCGTDMTIFPEAHYDTEDDYFLHRIGDDMARAGEKAGIPQMVFPFAWWGLKDPDAPSSSLYPYRHYKTITFITENTENDIYAYSPRDRARTSLAKAKAMLAWGNKRHPKLYYSGYPCMLAGGLFDRGLMSVGKQPAARRKSRIAIWRNLDAFKTLTYQMPQAPRHKIVNIEYTGEVLTAGVAVQTNARGKLKVAEVSVNGRKQKPSETNGYYTWSDGCATFVTVAMPNFKPGKHVIEIRYR